MTTDDLTAALHACAAGLCLLEAGTALLISNGTFLHRDDFTSRWRLPGSAASAAHAAAGIAAAETAPA